MYTQTPGHVVRHSDGACIPLDPANTDYAEFLAWCEEGNTPTFPEPPTVDDRRRALKSAATAKRFEVEVGGIELPNGTGLDTTREDQNAVANAIALADIAGVISVDFKAASGWLAITIPQLKQIGAAIGLHKQACYSAERVHHEAIDALPDAGLNSYAIETGWPTGADLASVFAPVTA